MVVESKTFSESWHRVAGQRVALHSAVRVRRQLFRGERWVVLENPFSNQFFRLRPEAYEFVARLRPDRTVEEVWKECLEHRPELAPGQEDVIRLLAQLYRANLLQYQVASDSAQLFQRHKVKRERELRARLLNLMFIRIPLLDPDAFLRRTLPLVGKCLGWVGGLIWLGVVAGALKVVIDHLPELRNETQSVLAPGNLPLLYLGLVILKTLHEFGHAYVCRFYGGEVHTMGVLFMIFTPVPYMDATSSWAFRSRWKRAFVGAAGMVVELFFAGIAAFVWANTAPGTLHSLAYNMIFVASVSTILFNANPLLRYDGYYILVDLLELPNLYQQSLRHLRHLAERYLFGLRKSESPARSRREIAWFTGFGIASGIYRVFVFGSILLFVADRFLILGMVMALICFITWILVPLGKFFSYLVASPALDRNRPRAVLVSLAILALLVGALEGIAFPSRFRAPGVLLARERSRVVTEAAGYVEKLLVEPGSAVSQGDALLSLRNEELDLDWSAAQARVEEVQARLRQASRSATAAIRPLESLLHSASNRLAKLELDRQRLTARAATSGIWVAPNAREHVGRWVSKGTELGLVVNPNTFEFTVTVRQEDANRLFAGRNDLIAEVRLRGQADHVLPVRALEIVPGSTRLLPSPTLGWLGGGEIPVAPEDPQGRTAAEPFFEVRARIDTNPEIAFVHGRSGKIRFETGTEPLLQQWFRRLRQVLQKRYQL